MLLWRSLFVSLLIYLSNLISMTSASGSVTRIIKGSRIEIFCPYAGYTKEFHYPNSQSPHGQAVNGHLIISEATFGHNGTFTCSNGRKTIEAANIQVVHDRGRYKAYLKQPIFVRGAAFRPSCELHIVDPSASQTFLRFIIDDEVILFTNVTKIDSKRFIFWFERSNSAQRSDDGIEILCEIQNPFPNPCCSRSRKAKIIIEEPLSQRKRDWLDKNIAREDALSLVFDVRKDFPLLDHNVRLLFKNGTVQDIQKWSSSESVERFGNQFIKVKVIFQPLVSGDVMIELLGKKGLPALSPVFYVGINMNTGHLSVSPIMVLAIVLLMVFSGVGAVIIYRCYQKRNRAHEDKTKGISMSESFLASDAEDVTP